MNVLGIIKMIIRHVVNATGETTSLNFLVKDEVGCGSIETVLGVFTVSDNIMLDL